MLILVMIVLIVILAAIAIAISTIAMALWTSFLTLSVTFSRLAMSMLIATGTSFFEFDLALFDNKFLNFILRTAIVYCIIWLLSYIPRVSPAIGTLCTFFISAIVTMITMGIGFSIIDLFTKKSIEINGGSNDWWFYLIVAIVTAICTIMNWLSDIKTLKRTSKNKTVFYKPIFIRIGRVIASVIYGLVLTFTIGLSMNSIIKSTKTMDLIMIITCTIVAYVADLFLFDRAAPPKKKMVK